MGFLDLLNTKKAPTPVGGPGGEAAPLAIPDIVAPAAINLSPKHVNMSGKYISVFFAVSYPRYLTDGWLEPILNLEREMDISIVVHLSIPQKHSKNFRRKLQRCRAR